MGPDPSQRTAFSKWTTTASSPQPPRWKRPRRLGRLARGSSVAPIVTRRHFLSRWREDRRYTASGGRNITTGWRSHNGWRFKSRRPIWWRRPESRRWRRPEYRRVFKEWRTTVARRTPKYGRINDNWRTPVFRYCNVPAMRKTPAPRKPYPAPSFAVVDPHPCTCRNCQNSRAANTCTGAHVYRSGGPSLGCLSVKRQHYRADKHCKSNETGAKKQSSLPLMKAG